MEPFFEPYFWLFHDGYFGHRTSNTRQNVAKLLRYDLHDPKLQNTGEGQ